MTETISLEKLYFGGFTARFFYFLVFVFFLQHSHSRSEFKAQLYAFLVHLDLPSGPYTAL